MNRTADALLMGAALELARKGLSTVTPNPAVGCILVKEGRIIGRGYHKKPGTPHAEIHALNEAGNEACGADLYVNLEPCSHHGRTPPCADAIIEAGVARVVAAMRDPNPLVAGRGFKKLTDAGIAVEVGVLEEEARRLNEAFIVSINKNRSFAHLKLAATLDGKTGTATGDSKWITSPESRRIVHELRKTCGAVLVGVGTANGDDPELTARLPGEREVKTLRVVLDPRLTIRPDLKMLAPGEAAHTLVICGPGANEEARKRLTDLGALVEEVPLHAHGGLNLDEVLRLTYGLGRKEILVEGGSRTARAFLDQGIIDRVHFFYAPKILGGSNALPMFGGGSPAKISDSLEISGLEVEKTGPDIYVTGIPSGTDKGKG